MFGMLFVPWTFLPCSILHLLVRTVVPLSYRLRSYPCSKAEVSWQRACEAKKGWLAVTFCMDSLVLVLFKSF